MIPWYVRRGSLYRSPAPKRLLWLYWQAAEGGFEADWVLVHAAPHAKKGLAETTVSYVLTSCPGVVTSWGAGIDGVTLSSIGKVAGQNQNKRERESGA